MDNLQSTFSEMKRLYLAAPMPDLDSRVAKLKHLRQALNDNKINLCEAVSKDFGHRSSRDSLMIEIMPCISNIDYTLEQLEGWMKPSQRHPGELLELSSTVEVVYQPKGIVGIISTWNAPIGVSINPLITAIAAGNRAMIKMSEFTPQLNKALAAMLACVFETTEVVLIEGEADVAAAFSSLPFDHILFTGSTSVGRLVMKSASANLTPVTLELGGKSPVIIDSSVSIQKAVERIIVGKSVNNGQVCLAPDYVLIPENRISEFCSEYLNQYQSLFVDGVSDPLLTSVINQLQFGRIQSLLADAQLSADKILPCHPHSMDTKNHRMVTHLIVNPADSALVLQDEIFGPLLAIRSYQHIDEAIAFVRSKARPLALYLMSDDQDLQDRMTYQLHSGGMCINDAVFQASVEDAPFGGTGESGMGNYHGHEGFITFSHAKTILKTGENALIPTLFSPEKNKEHTILENQFFNESKPGEHQ